MGSAGYKTQVRQLADYYDSYGLEGADVKDLEKEEAEEEEEASEESGSEEDSDSE